MLPVEYILPFTHFVHKLWINQRFKNEIAVVHRIFHKENLDLTRKTRSLVEKPVEFVENFIRKNQVLTVEKRNRRWKIGAVGTQKRRKDEQHL